MSARDRAILRAVAVGRAELVCGCVPHLLVDGLHVCDQDTHALAGLIAPAIPGRVGSWRCSPTPGSKRWQTRR